MVHELWVNGQKVSEHFAKSEAWVAFKAAKNVTEKAIKSYVRH